MYLALIGETYFYYLVNIYNPHEPFVLPAEIPGIRVFKEIEL